jgi:hypothetical protein
VEDYLTNFESKCESLSKFSAKRLYEYGLNPKIEQNFNAIEKCMREDAYNFLRQKEPDYVKTPKEKRN